MNVIGEGAIKFCKEIDECPHVGTDDELWQESFVIYMWDVEENVYVFLRMSQVPNKGVGVLWLNVWTPEYQYKLTRDDFPAEQTVIGDNSMSVANNLCAYQYDGNHNWQVHDIDAGIEIDLQMIDHHPGLAYFVNTEALNNVAKDHIEATGSVNGTVSVKGKSYQLGGATGWRDHSWGRRDWFQIRSHRFFPAMFGKEFNFFCMTLTGEDGSFAKNGIIIRNENVEFTTDFDIVACMGEDAVSVCGGEVTLRHAGEVYVMKFEMIGQSSLSMTFGFPLSDGVCKVTMGDKVGVGVCETSTNPQGGRSAPYVIGSPSSAVGLMENGLFPISQ